MASFSDGRVVFPPDPQLDDVLKAVGNQRRREIMLLLADGELFGQVLAKAASLDDSQFCKWMQQLVRAGVVDQKRARRERVYWLTDRVRFCRRNGDTLVTVRVGELKVQVLIPPSELRSVARSKRDLAVAMRNRVEKVSLNLRLGSPTVGATRPRRANAQSPPRRST